MDGFIKQSTAHTFQMGPFLDDTTGKDAETALTIAYSSVFLSKHGAAFAAKNDTTDLTGTGDTRGYYDCVLNTTDTGTVGCLKVCAHISGALPVWHTFVVLPAETYDSLVAGVGTDFLQVDCRQLLGTAFATPDTAGYPKVTVKVGTGTGEINLSSGKTPATLAAADVSGNPSVNAAQVGGATVASGAIPNVAAGANGGLPTVDANNAVKVQSGTGANQISLSSGLVTLAGVTHTGATIPTVTNLTNAPTNGDLTATMKSSVTAAVPTAAAIADSVWDEASTGHTDAGKAGAQVWTDIDAILEDTGTTLDGKLPSALVGGKMDSHVNDIANDAITAASIAAGAGTEIAAAVWDHTGSVTSIALELLMERVYQMINNKMVVTEATGVVSLKNIGASGEIASGKVEDAGATTERNELTWA